LAAEVSKARAVSNKAAAAAAVSTAAAAAVVSTAAAAAVTDTKEAAGSTTAAGAAEASEAAGAEGSGAGAGAEGVSSSKDTTDCDVFSESPSGLGRVLAAPPRERVFVSPSVLLYIARAALAWRDGNGNANRVLYIKVCEWKRKRNRVSVFSRSSSQKVVLANDYDARLMRGGGERRYVSSS
jgi:hypothetical protein